MDPKDRDFTPEQLREKYDAIAEDGHWGQHPVHTMEDWQYEVSEGNTRVGYFEWVAAKFQEELEEEDS